MLTTEEAIQKLAAELPEGYSVTIDIERGISSVALLMPNDREEDIHPDHGSMGERLLAALARAEEHDRTRYPPQGINPKGKT